MLSEPVPMDATAERIPRRIDAMGGGGGSSSNDNNDIRCLEARQKGVVRIGRLRKQQTEEVECLRLCVCMFGLGCALVPRSSEGHDGFLTALNLLS
ncbi:hypothetical protein GQ607_009349 [Colletotrichum asianum]|uniref:Uncharacterized protein n=1 Tax=Colletotrichum asianum TaxID=702518 RepID=A0A8H3ZQ06_9PEZI|nr:hypothetical protein GQ607_009349 [Colletotrichum asianum]